MLMMIRTRISLFAIILSFCVPGLCQNIGIVPDSTEPRIQLTGENFQIHSNGIYFTDFVPGRTMSRYGVLGTDLGYPVVYPDKIVFLFGDTMAVTTSPKLPGGNQPRKRGRQPGMPPPASLGGPIYYLTETLTPSTPTIALAIFRIRT